MRVMWVSNPGSFVSPVLHYGEHFYNLSGKVEAQREKYNVGHLGFHGEIYSVTLKGLAYKTNYYYKVGD